LLAHPNHVTFAKRLNELHGPDIVARANLSPTCTGPAGKSCAELDDEPRPPSEVFKHNPTITSSWWNRDRCLVIAARNGPTDLIAVAVLTEGLTHKKLITDFELTPTCRYAHCAGFDTNARATDSFRRKAGSNEEGSEGSSVLNLAYGNQLDASNGAGPR
jgi:hypothetical protein